MSENRNCRQLPTFILIILLTAALSITIALFSTSMHSLRSTYEHDLNEVNNHIQSIESKQSSYQQQIQTLSKLVVKQLNATDEYINNITNTVTEAKDVINQDIMQVNELADSQNSLLATQFAGMFTVLVILVSGYHLSQHLRQMHSPVVQRKIMAVLWMTPIYSITSWLSLVFPTSEPYLAVIREFYESYCVYTFLSFLISVLGRGDRWAVVQLLEQSADQLSPPDKFMCGCDKALRKCWVGCCNRCGKRRRVPPNEVELVRNGGSGEKMGGRSVGTTDTTNDSAIGAGNGTYNNSNGALSPNSATSNASSTDAYREENYPSNDRAKAEAVLDQCQTYAMQFVLLRPLTAIGWLISNKLVEPKSFLDWTSPQLYITIVTNASIFFAFRGLVKFYHATRRDLEWCNPWPKFLCIKGVVFMTFWQKMTISIIVNVAYADKFDSHDDADDFVKRAQNFLICLEMLFAATAHCFVFSPDEWAEGYRQREEMRRKSTHEPRFGDGIAMQDFIQDVKLVMASKRRRKRRKKMRNGSMDDAISPNSTMSNDDDDEHYDLSLTHSIGHSAEEETPPRRLSLGSLDEEGEGLGQGLHGDGRTGEEFASDDEYEIDLASPANKSPAPRNRFRTDTSDSNISVDDGDVNTSLARIENFLRDSKLEASTPNTKEIV